MVHGVVARHGVAEAALEVTHLARRTNLGRVRVANIALIGFPVDIAAHDLGLCAAIADLRERVASHAARARLTFRDGLHRSLIRPARLGSVDAVKPVRQLAYLISRPGLAVADRSRIGSVASAFVNFSKFPSSAGDGNQAYLSRKYVLGRAC